MTPAPKFSPTAVPVVDVARILSAAAGFKVPENMIAEDMDGGAPVRDGTINLLHYAAWLTREMANEPA